MRRNKDENILFWALSLSHMQNHRVQENAEIARKSCSRMECNFLQLEGSILYLDLIDLRMSHLARRRYQEDSNLGFPWKLQDQNCRIEVAGQVAILKLAGRSCSIEAGWGRIKEAL